MRTATGILSAALIGIALLGCSPYHKRHQAARRLYRILYREVRQGDSREDVESLIGTGSACADHYALARNMRKRRDSVGVLHASAFHE